MFAFTNANNFNNANDVIKTSNAHMFVAQINNNDENNNNIYECPWVCDTKKFEKDLQSKPQLKQQLSVSQRCSPETEQRDCGSCVPNRVFSV